MNSAPNYFPTDPGLVGSATNAGSLIESGSITVTDTGAVNDYAPAGFANARYVLINAATTLTINGIAGGVDGRLITFINISTSGAVGFSNESAASAAANRFHNLGSSTQSLIQGTAAAQTITYRYNGAAQRWQQIATNTTFHGEAMTVSGSFTANSTLSGHGTLIFTLTTNVTLAAGTTNDWAPITANNYRVDPSSGAATVTGLATVASSGRIAIITNVSTVAANTLTLTNEDALSTAVNRFVLPAASPLVIRAGGSLTLKYDGTSARWRPIDVL